MAFVCGSCDLASSPNIWTTDCPELQVTLFCWHSLTPYEKFSVMKGSLSTFKLVATNLALCVM